ncbi:caspase family protein [Streptomyces inhibens]|uniref:caspase family protein n=1 Tax=Streptomyces inhibens TaxID=2293571 RepID=UPI0037BB850F
MPSESEPRRFLIATATAHYKNEPTWDRPGLVDARQDIIDLFTKQFGYEHVSDLGLDPGQHQLTERLRAFCRSSEREEDDLVAVYLAGHGEVLDEEDGGGHVLLTHDTQPDDITDALPTELLARKMLSGTRVRRLLLMLDTCYSGQGGNELTAAALRRLNRAWGSVSGTGLVIVSSAQPFEQAEAGAFPRMLREAVENVATAGHGPRALALEAVVQQMNAHGGHQRVGLTQVGLTGKVPAFFPNPRHDPQLTHVDLAVQQEAAWQREADRRDVELHTRLLKRAMGSADPGRHGWWFAGRRTALGDITDWLAETRSEPTRCALVVTAGPGSGKTAVLGLFAALAHDELRHTVPVHTLELQPATVAAARSIDVAVYAQSLTNQQLLEALAAAAKVHAATIGELVEALQKRDSPLTVLIDGLDEATTPDTLCTGIVRPLMEHAGHGIRLLLGTRPHLLPGLGLLRDQQVDLDADRYADPEAVTSYTMRNLLQADPASPYRTCVPTLRRAVAAAVAGAAGRSFLVARIAAGTLAAVPEVPDPQDAEWRANLPKHADQAMARDLSVRLGTDAGRAADLLRPLAYAQGQGLPWEDLWAPLASSVSGRRYTDADIAWLREVAGSYVVEAVEDNRSAYRLYHQALAEHLRNERCGEAVHKAITRTLVEHVPYAANGTREWTRAHPYILRYIATHAAHGGVLDELLEDPECLVHIDPDGLSPHLDRACGDSAQLAAAVYRSSFGAHRTTTAERRRQILALDAARYNDQALLSAISENAEPRSWTPLHATGGSVTSALRNTLTSTSGPVTAVVCTAVDGRPVVVAAYRDRSVRVWDPVTGLPHGRPLTGHSGVVEAMTCTVLDRRPVVVTASRDRTVRVWDLTTGQQAGQPFVGHTGTVRAVACTSLNGRPVVVSGGDDGTVHVWDPATGRAVGRPMSGHAGAVTAVACAVLSGRTVAVSGSEDRTVRVWDLATGQPRGELFAAGTSTIESVACTQLMGRTVVVTCSWDESLCIWDLGTGRAHRRHRDRFAGTATSLTCTVANGRPVAVVGFWDGTVRVWDLESAEVRGQPLSGHTEAVNSIAYTILEGRSVAVTGADDGTIRIWDLAADRSHGVPHIGHAARITAMACTAVDKEPIAVTGSRDGTVRFWSPLTGRHGPLLPDPRSVVQAIACTALDGAPVALSGGNWADLQMWDLSARRPYSHLSTQRHSDRCTAMACTVLDGRPVAISGSHSAWNGGLQIWDLQSGTPRDFLGPRGPVTALACARVNDVPVAVIIGAAGVTSAYVWDLANESLHSSVETGHSDTITTVACTVWDEAPLMVTGSWDGTVRVRDLTSGQSYGPPFVGHTDRVTSVACGVVDGRALLFSGSRDHTVRVWDLVSGSTTAVLKLPAVCSTVAFADPELLVCTFGSDIASFGFHT